MTYAKPLPNWNTILWLAQFAKPFPKTSQAVLNKAREKNFSRHVQDFITLFPADEKFDSEEDFLTRCEELELLISEERQMPDEILNSPQD